MIRLAHHVAVGRGLRPRPILAGSQRGSIVTISLVPEAWPLRLSALARVGCGWSLSVGVLRATPVVGAGAPARSLVADLDRRAYSRACLLLLCLLLLSLLLAYLLLPYLLLPGLLLEGALSHLVRLPGLAQQQATSPS